MSSIAAGSLPSFAGIALADVLANGVAMVIILIVISLSLGHEQEKQHLREMEEVSVLLSRDIATSVVMNGLPSSAAAWLHDYADTQYQKGFDHMPTLELYRNYLREGNTNEIFMLDELLLPAEINPLDALLKSMTKNQLANIRVDVYDIQLFYITMSIIQNYVSHLPRHWHFLGGEPPSLTADRRGYTVISSDTAESLGLDSSVEGGAAQGNAETAQSEALADEVKDNFGSVAGMQLWDGLPGAVMIESDSLGGREQDYPFDDLAYDSDQAHSASGQYGTALGQGTAQVEIDSSAMMQAMSEEMQRSMRSQSSESSDGMPASIAHFRTARPENHSSHIEYSSREGQSPPSVNQQHLIEALLAYMKEAQLLADQGDFGVLARFDFEKDVIARIQNRSETATSEVEELSRTISEALSIPSKESTALSIVQAQSADIRCNSLYIRTNRNIGNATFLTSAQQEPLILKPSKVKLTLDAGLYPTIFRGLRLALTDSHFILTVPPTADEISEKWRLVNIISPQRDDFVLAFVHASVDEDGHLWVGTDSNNIFINDTSAVTFFAVSEWRKMDEATFAFLLIGILLLLVTARLYRKLR